MNILYLTSGLNMGGTELFALDLVNAMKTFGHNPLWGTAKKGNLKSYVQQLGVKIIDCGLDRQPFPNPLKAIYRLYKVTKRERIDIIHAVDAYSAIIACLTFRYSNSRPKIVWSNVGIGISTYNLMYKICSQYLDAITTETQYVRNRLVEASFEPEQIQVFHKCRPMKQPSISRECARKKLGLSENDVVIGTVGRVVRDKGNHTVIHAMPEIIKEYPNAKLLIVGNGPEEENLKRLVQELGLENSVKFEGFHSDIENIYIAFDIVAFPTYNECLGHICFEAMYYRKPLVASFTGGNIENVQNEVTGILVPSGISSVWAKAILRIISDKQFAKSLVYNGTNYIEQKDANRSVTNEEINKMYHNLFIS